MQEELKKKKPVKRKQAKIQDATRNVLVKAHDELSCCCGRHWCLSAVLEHVHAWRDWTGWRTGTTKTTAVLTHARHSLCTRMCRQSGRETGVAEDGLWMRGAQRCKSRVARGERDLGLTENRRLSFWHSDCRVQKVMGTGTETLISALPDASSQPRALAPAVVRDLTYSIRLDSPTT